MTSILLSAAARQSVSQLQIIDTLMSAAGGRLASGKKVAGPSDNPAAFFDALSLTARAGDLNRLIDASSTKLQTLKAADSAINALISLVQSAMSDLDTALASAEPRPTATGNIIVSNQAKVKDLGGVSTGDTFTVQVGAASSVEITIDNNDTPTDLLNKLNAVANIDASFTTEGFLKISTATLEDLILTDTGNTPLAGLGITAGTFGATSSISAIRTTAAADFAAIRTQIDQLAGDGSFKGVNLLNGDALTFKFNETGSSTLTVAGVTFNAAGLSIAAAANNFQLDINITAAKADLEAALDTLRGFSSTLSTNITVVETRQTFNTQLVGLLQEGADNLTLADLNKESAILLSLKTRRDLTLAGFSIVQASENSILRLF